MQPADRLESAQCVAAHDGVEAVQRRAGDGCRRLVDAGAGRRVAVVDRAVAFLGFLLYPRHVIRRMEAPQLLLGRHVRV
ncbi:hypothetical protein D3C83_19690 [compost metagenome]